MGKAEISTKSNMKLIVALMAGYSVVYMDKNMISTAIIPIAEQFHLTPTQTGFIMSMFFLGYSLMQIPGGWLADKVGAKKVLMVSLGTISCFSFLFGAVSSLMLFMTIRFFAGIGHGGYPPSCSKSVAENFSKEKRTMVQSGILTTAGIGGILAFTLGASAIAQNWRYGYILLGCLFLGAFLLVTFFVPKDISFKEKTSEKKSKTKFLDIVTNKNVIILFVVMLFLNIMYYGALSWLPSYLTRTYHLSLQSAGYILAVNAISQLIGSFFTGVLLSKLFVKKERFFIMLCAIIISISIFILINTSNLPLSVVLVAIIGMLSISAFTAVFTWPQKLFATNAIGSSIGIINTGGTLGGFLAPIILGRLIEQSGGSFTTAFIFLAICVIIAGLGTFAVKTKHKGVEVV